MTNRDEFREKLLKLLAEVKHQNIQVLIDSDLFVDAQDLFEEDEVDDALIERAKEDKWPELDDDE